MTHKISGKTSMRGAAYRLIRSSYMHMSKWTGQYCYTDPARSNDEAREQVFSMENVLERAERGGARGRSRARDASARRLEAAVQDRVPSRGGLRGRP
eukprot:4772286-Alexandrium_andersonii.AAC.1